MPTILTHAAVGLALATALRPSKPPRGYYVAAALLPVVPDADGPLFGAHGASEWSHRGATHSLAFAALLAVGTVFVFYRAFARERPRRGVALWALFFLVVAAHGLLDAATDGGSGVMLLWPFSEARTFWAWRPIAVAPLRLDDFFSSWGANVLVSEALNVWGPMALLVLAAEAARRALRGISTRTRST